MLSALHNIDHVTASKVLSDIAQDLLPYPGVNQLIDARRSDSELHSSVLREARQKVKVNIDDNSLGANGKLLNFISREISNIVIQGNKDKEAKDRLGQSGDLNLELYNIVFPNEFARYLKYGIRKTHIESAIRSPDYFQHLLPQITLENSSGFTLFTKYHGSDIHENSFVLLVQAQRHKSTLAVTAAWRVYLSDVNLSKALWPIDVLREFVEIYGFDEDWGIAVSKFLFNEVVTFEEALNNYQLENRIKKINPQGICIFVAHRDKARHLLNVAVAYAIDLKKYELDLKKHGVHLTL